MDGRFVRQLVLAIYLLVGLYGSIWLSDDYDELRLTLLSFVGFPLICTYYYMLQSHPLYRLRYRKIYLWHAAAMASVFLYGHVLLWNAALGTSDVYRRNLTAEDKKKVLSVATHKGGLGILYTKRW